MGETLNADGDAIMEEVDTGSARRLGDPIELNDIEEDDEGELSESTITVPVFQLLIKIGGARMNHQRVDRSGLRILQAYSSYRICRRPP